MFIALVVIMTSLTLPIILMIGAKQKHQFDAGIHVFHYSTITKWMVYCSFPAAVYFGFWGVKTMIPGSHPQSVFDWIFVGIFVFLAFVAAIVCVYTKNFLISVGDDILLIRGITSNQVIQFSDIENIDLSEGKSSVTLTIYNKAKKRVLSVGSTLQDFSGLVQLLKERCDISLFRYRDKWGKWTPAR